MEIGQFKKGHIPWNKGIRGATNSGSFRNGHKQLNTGKTHWTKESVKSKEFQDKRLKSLKFGEDHHNWKGDSVGYVALHTWVRNKLGKPSYCAMNKIHIGKRFEWANISREYFRNLNDWISLCPSCHRKYDLGILELN